MAHKLNLMKIPFYCVKNNRKKYEIRLNSETRHNIKVNDIIIFRYQKNTVIKKVKNKHVFKSLWRCFDILDIGLILPSLLIKTKINAICHYHSIYSPIRIKKHSIVVFELE